MDELPVTLTTAVLLAAASVLALHVGRTEFCVRRRSELAAGEPLVAVRQR